MEGPSLIMLKEQTNPFKGKKVLKVEGYAVLDKNRMLNLEVIDIKTWGKHYLICFEEFTLKIHFLLFGSYLINNRKEGKNPTIRLKFSNGELNCYVCSLKYIEEDINQVYDWSLDMLSTAWNPVKVKKILDLLPRDEMIGDVLLDANIFSGVGNIIRNEVLYRVKLHPDSTLGRIPTLKIIALINETRTYSLDFLRWKRTDELKNHWEVYTKEKCPSGHPIVKKYTGKTKRRSYICQSCIIKFD